MLLFLLIVSSVSAAQTRSQNSSADDKPKKLQCHTMTIQKACPNMNVTFWLYNDKVMEYNLNEFKVTTITQAPFNDNPIKIILHGYTGHRHYHPNNELRPVYLNSGISYNVISIDYGPVALFPCYIQSVVNAIRVAKCFAEFIYSLLTLQIENRSSQRITLDDIHVVGYSLGAQVAGNAGKRLRRKYNMTLPRLTALDSAMPGFYLTFSRVSRRSAKFVDSVHTNAGFYGKILPVGHVDFYFNYIFFQKGCKWNDRLCNHDRAPAYFAESITASDPVFCGRKRPWDSYGGVLMGEHVKHTTRGIYFVKTNENSPYARDAAISC